MPKYDVQTEVTIKGTVMEVKIEGSDALIAREITKGSEKLTLRDPKGIPLWSQRRSR